MPARQVPRFLRRKLIPWLIDCEIFKVKLATVRIICEQRRNQQPHCTLIMASTFLPFLYQTRTLQRCAKGSISLVYTHRAYATQQRPLRRKPRIDQSIPFELDEEDQHLTKGDIDDGQSSTITPSEAEVFKGIFDEIAQGRMPKARKRHALTSTDAKAGEATEDLKKDDDIMAADLPSDGPKSIVDQFRTSDFRDKFLDKYPASLRKAAEMAMGKFEMDPMDPQRPKMVDMTELDEEEAAKHKEWARYMEVQEQEKQRVEGLMEACQSDVELWKVMEQEVFSLPKKLGILQEAPKPARGKKTRRSKNVTSTSTANLNDQSTMEQNPESADTEERVMVLHGPLYPHYLTKGLALFDTAFPSPSPLAFKILPRVKELGLPSYVLGVTTPFYLKLAQMHWNHFGDAASTFDMLEEMSTLGLAADEETAAFLEQVRDHLHGCTWGAQGSFVMAMMEAAPYDSALMMRLEAAEKYVRRSFALQNRR